MSIPNIYTYDLKMNRTLFSDVFPFLGVVFSALLQLSRAVFRLVGALRTVDDLGLLLSVKSLVNKNQTGVM